jgi:hypothetical protein
MRGCLGDLDLYVAQDFQHCRPLIEKREHRVDGVLLLMAELIKIASSLVNDFSAQPRLYSSDPVPQAFARFFISNSPTSERIRVEALEGGDELCQGRKWRRDNYAHNSTSAVRLPSLSTWRLSDRVGIDGFNLPAPKRVPKVLYH